MNRLPEALREHRTYRQFQTNERLPENDIQTILAAATRAPSWMNGQHYTIIRITNPQLRQKIVAANPSNPQIGQAAEYWLFIADAHRAALSSQHHQAAFDGVATPDTLLTLTTDAALAAQNAVVAAESLGYAICFTGGIRLIAPELVEWLHLPKHTFPLFGLMHW